MGVVYPLPDVVVVVVVIWRGVYPHLMWLTPVNPPMKKHVVVVVIWGVDPPPGHAGRT